MVDYKERYKKLGIFFTVFVLFYGVYLLFDFPTFLFIQYDKYKDFATINYALKDMNPYLSGLSNYPPLILIFALIFARMGDWSLYNKDTLQNSFYENSDIMHSFMLLIGIYAVLMIAAGVFYGVVISKKEQEKSLKNKILNVLIPVVIIAAFIFSAPSLYMIDRGNYLMITIVFLMFGFILESLFETKVLGASFIALAAATKVYPVYLLGTYLTEKKWKKLLTAIAVGVVVTIIPIFFFKGNVFANFKAFIDGVLGFGGASAGEAEVMGNSIYFNVGFTGFLGLLYKLRGSMPNGRIIKLCLLVVGFLFTFMGFSFTRTDKKLWRKALIVVSLMVFLSPNSYLYNSCYLFAPVFLMLMDKEKLDKKDIPYYVMTALLLVPKSYFYFADFYGIATDAIVNSVNSAVLFDALLYIGILGYYFVTMGIEAYKKTHEEEIYKNNLLLLKARTKKVYFLGACFASLVMMAFVLYTLKDTVLSCHDSFMEFIYARLNKPTYGFEFASTYGLARGRVGFIFPTVVMFRYLINGSGNYALIWLLQYVPVCANVFLISYIVGKKTKPFYGAFFTLFFFALLQVDVWHSLIVTYPLDFMYGTFVMIWGLYLFNEYLAHKDLENKSKKNILRLIGSLILYYESMQVYEAFIVASIIYAVFALNYSIKKESTLKSRIICFIKTILPHFVVAIIYVGLLAYLRSHPVNPEIGVSEISSEFNIGRIMKTYVVFSTGMFPLKDINIIPDLSTIFTPGFISKKAVIVAFIVVLGTFAELQLVQNHYGSLSSEEKKKINRTFVSFIICGLIIALTFAFPHSLINSYQDWVIVGQVGGYVPSTICYFGWSLVLLSLFFLLNHFIVAVPNKRRIALSIAMAIALGFSSYVTVYINSSFRAIESTNGTWMSIKAQTFYSLITNDEFRNEHYDLVYTRDLDGIHGNIQTTENLADYELGYDIEFAKDYDNFMEKYDNYSNQIMYTYDSDAYVGMLIDVDDYTSDVFTTTSDVTLIASEGGVFELTYETTDSDEEITLVMSIPSNAITNFEISDEVVVSSIDFTRVG